MSEVTELENKLIVFQLEEEEYAVSVQYVGSIERILPITRVPSAPEYVKGVINLRGIVIPVIDLKRRFYKKETVFTEQTRIIIVNVEDLIVGLIVDAAHDVIDIQAEQIEPAPASITAVEVAYIRGVVKLEKRLIILLALEKVLYESEAAELSAIEG